MITQHTPGPWEAIDKKPSARGNYCFSVEPGGEYRGDICYIQACEHIGGISNGEVVANVRLIAAAPEMLEALEVTAENIRSLGPAGALSKVFAPYEEWLKVVEAAIARAKGVI
jgi:hypothetical protein